MLLIKNDFFTQAYLLNYKTYYQKFTSIPYLNILYLLLHMSKEPRFKQFWELAQQRKIELKNSKKQSELLFKKFQENARQSTINEFIKQACVNPKQIQLLTDLLAEIRKNPQLIKVRDRLEENREIIESLQRRWCWIEEFLNQNNQNKDNVFEKFYKQSALSQEPQGQPDIMFVLATPFKIKQVWLNYKDRTEKFLITLQTINKIQYTYSLFKRKLQEQSKLILKYQEENGQQVTIEVKEIKTYLKQFDKAAIIALDFTNDDPELVRTTSILYSIGGLSQVFNQLEKNIQKAYQWMSLLYQQCFKLQSSDFKIVTNFEVKLPSWTQSNNKQEKTMQNSILQAKYSVSRLFTYILMALLTTKSEIMTLYIKKESKLINSLKFPLLKENTYVQNKHLPQFQKIYLQLCWRFSLKVDKEKDEYRVAMSKNAIFSQEDSESMEIIKILLEQCPNVLALFQEDDILKAITRNKYIAVGTILSIFERLLKPMKQLKKKLQFQNLLIKLFNAILMKLQKEAQIQSQINRRQVWDEQITRQLCESIFYSSNASIFVFKNNWLEFYIVIKKISFYNKEIYSISMSIIQKELSQNFKSYEISVKSIEAFSRLPQNRIDQSLIRNGIIPHFLDLSQVEKIMTYRYQNEKMKNVNVENVFNFNFFDESLLYFLENVLRYIKDLKKIGEALKMLDKIVIKFDNLEQICKIATQILEIIDFQNVFFKRADDLAYFLRQIISLKTKVKEKCYDIIKDKLLACKIQRLDEIIFQLQGQMQEIDRQYLQYIQRNLKKGKSKDKQSQKLNFWNALLDSRCSSKLKSFTFNKQSLQSLVEIAKNKIESNDFYENELSHLYANKSDIAKVLGQLGQQICNQIQNSSKLLASFKQKLKDFKELLERFECFIAQLAVVNKVEEKIHQVKLCSLYQLDQLPKEIKQFIQIATNFKRLIIPSIYWEKRLKMYKIHDFLQIYHNINEKMTKELTRLSKDQAYQYSEYQTLILNEPIEEWCKLLFKHQSSQIQETIQLLRLQRLKLINQIIESIQEIEQERDKSKTVRSSFTNFKNLFSIVLSKQKVGVKILLNQVISVLNHFQVDFKVNNNRQILADYKVKVVCLVRKHKNMLKQIKSMKITAQIILNLKQYISGQVYGSIKNEQVTSFQEVILFVQNTSNKKFVELIMYLKKEQNKADRLKSLTQSIQACSGNFENLKEKLKQAEDRQTSFKDQIQLIFNNNEATWNIELDSLLPHKLSYFLQLKQSKSIIKRNSQKIFGGPSKMLYLKQLQFLAQNCLMFKTESQRNFQNKQFAVLLNKFLNFYQIISGIKRKCQRLLEYGYNPRELIKVLALKGEQNSKFQSFKQYDIEIERKLKYWKEDIMKAYKQSYFLTFFKGYAIQQVIIAILNKKMPQRLASQFQINEEDFLSIYGHTKIDQIKQLMENPKSQKQKLQFVKSFLINLEEKYKQKEKIKSSDMPKQSRKIFLLVTKQNKQIFHFCKEKDLSMHQVFFCLHETTILQLETFILRSLKGRKKQYFVVGAQWLSPDVKNQFFNVIKTQYNKGNDSQNQRQLYFIDTNSSDNLYCNLNWSLELDFKTKNDESLSQQQMKRINQNLIQHYFKKLKLVTSAKPGLGKTFYVEKDAAREGKKLVYFPICGNVCLKNLFQRLKDKKIDKNTYLLIQLGYFSPEQQKTRHNVMENLRILQIFLTQLIIFRKVYFEGDYVNVQAETSIFIQVQNLLQSAFYNEKNKKMDQNQNNHQKYQIHLLNLLENFKAKHHIEKFQLNLIQYRPQNLKDIFVYKYLQLLDSKTINSVNLLFQDLQPKISRQRYETLKVWLYSAQFKTFYLSLTQNSQYSKQNSLLSIIKQKANIDQKLLQKCVKIIIGFTPQQWQLYQHDTQKQVQFKKNRKVIQFQAQLSKIQEEISKYKVPIYPPNCGHLINKYFKNRHEKEITYRTYRYFMNILFEKINTFSQSSYLMPECFQYARNNYYLKQLQIPQIRQNFLNRLISNTSKLLQETTFTSIGQSYSEFYPNLESQSTMILSAKDFTCYQFVYKEDKKQDFPIKTLLATQTSQFIVKAAKTYANKRMKEEINQIFQKQSFNNLKEQDQEKKIMEILYSISQNKNFLGSLEQVQKKVKAFNEYRLTKDNFFKICYIIQKAVSNIPIIIMGQAGVGKTALIKFMVQQIFSQTLEVCNVHAGVHQQQIGAVIEKVTKAAKENKNRRVWVFFDEYNTSDQLSYIKEIVIDRRFLGEELPPNIIFCTACNPYRMRLNTEIRAFNVKPPNLSMVAFMWDYQQLKQQQCKEYCRKMLKQVNLKQKGVIIDTIVKLHQEIHRYHQKSYASLRDVARFKQLYLWFCDKLPKQPVSAIQGSYSKQNHITSVEHRALYLAYYFVYILKISDTRSKQTMIQIIQANFVLKVGSIQSLVKNQQTDFTTRLKQTDSKIAYNKALRENLFTSFVCILNKIPVLLIGEPGSSKSLSIKLINSNLRGKFSSNQFCRQFPQLLFHYFQGSQSSTSQGILKVFDVTNKKKPLNTQYCILFDEIGLAGKSIHNPLKVMHSKIETHNKDIAIIAISNEALDSAKMSRFLTISRQKMHLNQLIETAEQIYKAYIPNDQSKLKIVKKTAQNYYKFLQDQKGKQPESYYGLRDFYCLIKHICSKFAADMNANEEQVLRQAIRINFDTRKGVGQKQSKDYLIFLDMAGLKSEQVYKTMDQIINTNIKEPQSRYLLFAIQQNSIVYSLSQKTFEISQAKKKVKCMYGSPFQTDNSSQQYNVQFTSKIISYASNGGIIAIKDLNNSIQTSLYDLFNKSFTTIGRKKYCRVAVGDKSNPRCYISPQFLVIIFVMKDKLSKLDAPFLNRFQKHSLYILDELTPQQKNLLDELEKWIASVQGLWNRCKVKNRENYLLNTSRQCLASLICSTKEWGSRSLLFQLKRKIIQNSTSQFDALIRKVSDKQIQPAKSILQIKKTINEELQSDCRLYNPLKSKKDSIIYTFNTSQEVMAENQSSNQSVSYLKLSQNQKQLRQILTKQILSTNIKLVQVNCNFQKDKSYINYLLHLIKSIKEENIQLPTRRVRVVVELNRYLLLNYSKQRQNKGSPFKVNISYLYPFQQYFYDISMEQIIEFDTYQQLFTNSFTQRFRSKCILQAINYFRIVSEDKKQSAHYQYLCKVADISYFKNLSDEFICRLLSKDRLEYESLLFQQTGQKSQEKNKENSSNNFKQLLMRRLELKVVPLYRAIISGLVKSKMIYIFNISNASQEMYSDLVKELQFEYFQISPKIQEVLKAHLAKIEDEVNRNIDQENNNLVFNENSFNHPYSYELMNFIFYDQKAGNKSIQLYARHFFIQNQSKKRSFVVDLTAQNGQQKQFFDMKQFKNLKIDNKSQKFMILTDVINKLLSQLRLKKQLAIPVAYLLQTIEAYFDKVKIQGNYLQNETILLTINRQYWKILIQMIENLLKCYHTKDLRAQLLAYVSSCKRKSLHPRRNQALKESFECFIQSVLDLVAEKISINKYEKFSTQYIKIALQLFKKVNELIDLNNSFVTKYKLPYELALPSKNYVQLKLVELFVALNISSEDELLQNYIDKVGGAFNYVKIAQFCQELLRLIGQNKKQAYKVINYLAYGLFRHFSDQFEHLQNKTRIQMVRKAKAIANCYSQFANLLSVHFFPQLCKKYQSDSQDYVENLQYFLKQVQNDIFQLAPNEIGYFSISLSLYLRNIISNQFCANQQEQTNYDYAHGNLSEFHTLYLKLLSMSRPKRFAELFKNQFLKAYLQNSIDIVFFDQIKGPQQRSMLEQINKNLSSDKYDTIKHLRIYLFKYIYSKYKQSKSFEQIVEIIRDKSKQVFSWLKFCDQFLENNDNYYLPFNINNKDQPFLKQFIDIKDGRFKSGQVAKFIRQALTAPQKTYYLLTLFATLFYTEQVKQTERREVTNVVNSMSQLEQPENKIVKIFILLYIRGRVIPHQIEYQKKEIQKYKRLLPLINFLNLLIGYRLLENCYIEMFFTKGIPIGKLQQELKDKFIFGVLTNPQIIRCYELINQDQQIRRKYKKCQQEGCDYLFEAQHKPLNLNSSFTFSQLGEQSMLYNKASNIFGSRFTTENCPLCLSQPPREKKEPAQAFNLRQHFQSLKSKVVFKDLKDSNAYQLKGFQLKTKIQDMRIYKKKRREFQSAVDQQEEQNNNFSRLTKKILEMVVYFVWWVFSSVKQVNFSVGQTYKEPQRLKQIWEDQFTQILSQNVELMPKNQINICLYGICTLLKKQLNEAFLQKQKSTLLDQTAKIRFCQQFQRALTSSYAPNPQNFIKENICPRYATKEDIIKEEGLVQHHKSQYKEIQLFRIYQNVKINNLKDFNKLYLSSLSQTYPALYSMLYNIQKVQQVYKHLKVIYVFAYRIWMIYNFQLKKQCQNLSIIEILNNQILNKDSAMKQNMLKSLAQFYQSWNYFAIELNFKLEHGTELRRYDKAHFPLSHFIIDKNKTEESPMRIFISKTSKQYNAFCFSMEQSIQRHCFNNNKGKKVLNKVIVNPTFLSSQRQFWSVTSERVTDHIKKARHYSVTYGNSKCQCQFEQLQNALIKQLYSTHYLSGSSSFKLFYFIDSDPLKDLKELASYKQELTNDDKAKIKRLHEQHKDREDQFLQSLKYSLQKIIHYLKYFRSNLQQSIGEFLKKQQQSYRHTVSRIKLQNDFEQATTHPFREIDEFITRDPIASLPIARIISLFEFLAALKNKKQDKSPPKIIEESTAKQNKTMKRGKDIKK